ncbi:hypothetical protein GGX14DRAFT_85300 [Mycena pura]|uniref:Uncharacterized protein n=1 Tax=Mycena pura TaxID=153505 RepID=A0AAD6YGP2_9AGAR|nr:hypothetical protein GGX14DRAFT_85300 [Mycena pura]
MLQLRPDVVALPPDEAEKLLNLSAQLYNGTTQDPIGIVDQRDKLLQNIRKSPGLEYFLRPKSYDVLCQASQGGPIAILNSHPNGCDAILIPNPSSEPVHVPLPNVTPDILESQREKLKESLSRCHVRTRDETPSSRLFGCRENYSQKPVQKCFEELLHRLWTDVVEPIYVVLKTHGILKGRIWWLPTGAFTGLPLHASAPSDEFIHSYTATLGSLLDAYNKKPSTASKESQSLESPILDQAENHF